MVESAFYPPLLWLLKKYLQKSSVAFPVHPMLLHWGQEAFSDSWEGGLKGSRVGSYNTQYKEDIVVPKAELQVE